MLCEEYGGTRKYGSNSEGDGGRVQTAAAFVALLQELGEDIVEIYVCFKKTMYFLWKTLFFSKEMSDLNIEETCILYRKYIS